MTKLRWLVLFGFLFAIGNGAASAQTPATQTKEQAPDVTGDWLGVWWSYNPTQPASTPKEICKALSAKVSSKDGVWEATFEGECGRPYKYTITMEGRQAGGVVMFKGSADLGPRDGGVYDWIGRADNNEFVGFFTSAAYTGVFNMTRPK